jgi:hypothetical protein
MYCFLWFFHLCLVTSTCCCWILICLVWFFLYRHILLFSDPNPQFSNLHLQSPSFCMCNSHSYWFNRNFSHWNPFVSWVKPPFSAPQSRAAALRRTSTGRQPETATRSNAKAAAQLAKPWASKWGAKCTFWPTLDDFGWLWVTGEWLGMTVWCFETVDRENWIYHDLSESMILPHVAGVICRMSKWSCDSKIIAFGRAQSKSWATPKQSVCTTRLSSGTAAVCIKILDLPHPNKLCAKFVWSEDSVGQGSKACVHMFMSNGFPADCHSCHTLALQTRVWRIYDTSHRMERWARGF